MISMLLRVALWAAQEPTTSTGERVVTSPGSSAGVHVLAWILPLVVIGVIVFLVVLGFRHIGAQR